MAVNTYSHNLIVVDYTVRPDGKVAIRFSILKAGIFYNLRFATRAFPPGNTVGFPMTPALADPQHVQDPIIVATPGQTYTWVWDAPADGYLSVNTAGWTFFVAYLDMFCCESDEPVGRPPDLPTPPPPLPPLPPPPDVPPIPGVPPPTNPDPVPPTNPEPNPPTNNPSMPTVPPWGWGGFVRPMPYNGYDGPAWPGQPGATPQGGIVQTYGYVSNTLSIGSATFNNINGTWFDPYGNPVYINPQVLAAQAYQPSPGSVPLSTASLVPGGSVSPGLRSIPVANFPVTTQGSDPVPQGDNQVDVAEFGYQGNLASPSSPTTVSASIYTLPSTDGRLTIAAEMFPTTSPRDVGATVFVSVTNDGDTPVDGLYLYVEGIDSSGTRYTLSESTDVGTLPPSGSAGGTICTSWMSFITGAVNIVVTLMGPGGVALVSKVIPGQAIPPGAIPTPPTAVPELPTSVRDAAWGTGAPDIQPTFEGSYNALGEEDFYIIDAVSVRAGFVIKITADAKATGFVPVLKIFSETDFDTPILETTAKFAVQDADKNSFAIGWRDFAQFPLLTPGNRYYLQVVHNLPYYSRRWGFKIYTQETPVAISSALSVDGNGQLDGTISCAYGRQSLKILNTRTHDVLFVKTNSYGTADVQTNAAPYVDRLGVRSGDILKIYRPGMAVQYRMIDYLTSVTV
jgi:hypothetical protein